MQAVSFPLCRYRRSIAWLALLAVVLQLVASFVSSLHTSRSLIEGASTVELCTSAGIVRIALDDQGQPQAPDHVPAAQHCPFCASNAAGVAPILVVLTLLLPPTEAVALPLPEQPPPRPASPDLRHAPSRAPPVLAV